MSVTRRSGFERGVLVRRLLSVFSCGVTRLAAAAVVFAAAASPALAVRTFTVAQQTETSLTFSFSGADGYEYGLYLASGATDGGDDKGAWDAFEKVAEIEFDQTSFTYEVPAALRDGRPLRFFLMQTDYIAMAKEYRSVRSSGAQWINAGVEPAATWTCDFRFGDPVYVANTAFFGQNWAGSRYLFNQQGNVFKFHGGGTEVGRCLRAASITAV